MRFLLLITLAVLVSGCTSNGGQPATGGSENYQRCASQCGSGNAGNGSFCLDGCRVQEAEDMNNTAWCDQLDNPANRPSCYGTVAKSAGNRSVCDRLQEGAERNYCVSTFGPS